MFRTNRKLCEEDNCESYAFYGIMHEEARFCNLHKSTNMVNLRGRQCQEPKCKFKPLYGLPGKKVQFCHFHKQDNMVCINTENKCEMGDCENEYMFMVDDIKYCVDHCPNKNYISIIKRTCKYCDIDEHSTFVCNECENTRNKTEWSVVRYLRKNIKTPFKYNISGILQGCSAKRPDISFELLKHFVIVEVDEDQHRSYSEICECARLNEIVNGIGGRSVIFIRFNPDKIKNNGKVIEIPLIDRLDKLINIINDEITNEYDHFIVKLIQLYYDDKYEFYQYMKIEDITDTVCI
jgi:hypothetical protein